MSVCVQSGSTPNGTARSVATHARNNCHLSPSPHTQTPADLTSFPNVTQHSGSNERRPARPRPRLHGPPAERAADEVVRLRRQLGQPQGPRQSPARPPYSSRSMQSFVPADSCLSWWGVQERFGFTCPGTFYATPNAAVRGREKEQWLFEWQMPEAEEEPEAGGA